MIKANLKKLLEDRSMTMHELSVLTNIDYKTIQKIYYNRSKALHYSTIDKICDVLDCEINELLIREKKDDF